MISHLVSLIALGEQDHTGKKNFFIDLKDRHHSGVELS